ncbi:MAG: trpS [Chlorobi bacterium]|nr:trpS [Chlorobiota bacterium]
METATAGTGDNVAAQPAGARRRVFSGMQPSGEFHLGNYIGALKRWVLGQEEKENFFCVVDLHSLTVPQDPAELRMRTRQLTAIYLAAGIHPDKSTLFVQSHVTAHAEGCWLLNCVTPLGWLNKMTQYKDKSAKQESVLTGLLDYPVLMAADILLYDAQEVPTGEDQKQHIELARNIAERFNHLYGETFVVPEPVIAKVGARIMGLDNPLVKMSKSSSGVRGHSVGPLDDPAEIERSFKRAVTDPGNEIRFSDDPAKAGVNNLLSIYQVITGRSGEEVENDFANARGYGDLKKRVAEVVIEEFRPVREGAARLMADAAELDRLLARGAEQAAAVAMPKLREMKEKMGLIVP